MNYININKLIPKRPLLVTLFLSILPYILYGSKSVDQVATVVKKVERSIFLSRKKYELLVHGYNREYHTSEYIDWLITCFLDESFSQYKNKSLPADLSGQNLNYFDFTGCQFGHTNLTSTQLKSVILHNTTCDYREEFSKNIRINRVYGGNWYQKNLLEDLQGIAIVYPQLQNTPQKVRLLWIACAISRLPFYDFDEFYVKLSYWCYELFKMKNELGNFYGKSLTCSLESNYTWDIKDCCWKTFFPQYKVNLKQLSPHSNFMNYIREFKKGLMQYQCRSRKDWGFDHYKKHIIQNIEGLRKVYPKIKKHALQEEACYIAQALSKSYQLGQENLLSHYLFYQNQLIKFAESIHEEIRDDVHYHEHASTLPTLSWSFHSKDTLLHSWRLYS